MVEIRQMGIGTDELSGNAQEIRVEGRDLPYRARQVELKVPPEMLYEVDRDPKTGELRAGILATFYNIIALHLGIQWEDLEVADLHDGWGVRVRVTGTYANPQGRIVRDTQEVVYDIRKLYERACLGWNERFFRRDNVWCSDHYPLGIPKEYEPFVVDGTWTTRQGKQIPIKVAKAKATVTIDPQSGAPRCERIDLPQTVMLALYTKHLKMREDRFSKAQTVAHRHVTARAIGIRAGDIRIPREREQDWKSDYRIKVWMLVPVSTPAQEQKAVEILTGSPKALTPPAAPEAQSPTAPAAEKPVAPAAPVQAAVAEPLVCADCNAPISRKVKEFSESKFRRPICMTCQDKQRRASELVGAGQTSEDIPF